MSLERWGRRGRDGGKLVVCIDFPPTNVPIHGVNSDTRLHSRALPAIRTATAMVVARNAKEQRVAQGYFLYHCNAVRLSLGVIDQNRNNIARRREKGLSAAQHARHTARYRFWVGRWNSSLHFACVHPSLLRKTTGANVRNPTQPNPIESIRFAQHLVQTSVVAVVVSSPHLILFTANPNKKVRLRRRRQRSVSTLPFGDKPLPEECRGAQQLRAKGER